MFKSLRWVMSLLGAIGVTAALAVAAQGYHFINKLDQAAGQVYVAKDVVADILPPPMYLIEARLVLSLMLDGSMPVADGKKRFDELAAEYDQRVDHWTKNPPHGLEAKLLGAQHTAALAFLAAARSEVLAPLLAGQADAARAKLPAVHALYEQHRSGVNDTVTEGNAFAASAMQSCV
jgi:methyl-accepting chemotaxis protein-1 (serine sensor receptor)